MYKQMGGGILQNIRIDITLHQVASCAYVYYNVHEREKSAGETLVANNYKTQA